MATLLNSDTKARDKARGLRQTMSESERRLWRRLRAHNIGFHCRRQIPMGPYVLDFYIHEAKVAIEVDGDLHTLPEKRAKDAVRDAFFAKNGIETLRFPTTEIYTEIDAVVEVIYRRCCERAGREPFPEPPEAPNVGEG